MLRDQRKEFDNKLFKRLSEITGIKPSKTTAYHPIGNGFCKRMNQTLLNMLKTLAENFKNVWKSQIKKLTFAHNNIKNKTTGFSPHFLLFERNGRLPVDLAFDLLETWSYNTKR